MNFIYNPALTSIPGLNVKNQATTHRELRMERTPTGKILIMPPTRGETGKRNFFSLLGQL